MKNLISLFLSFSIFILGLIISNTNLKAQVADGANFDFSLGDFTNWKGYQSNNNSSSTTIDFDDWILFENPNNCMHSGKNCFVINTNFSQYDMNVGATKLIKIPSFLGFSKSVQINVDDTGANANYLAYDLLVSSDNSMITFNYALVFESPSHTGYENPFFQVEILSLDSNNVENGRLHPSTFYEVKGELPMPEGWSLFNNSGSSGIWQNWRQLSMDLNDYIGQKVRIKVLITACSSTNHWAYGYFVGKVASRELEVNPCPGLDTIAAILSAPPGFAKYEWFENPNDLPESQLSMIADTATPLDVREVVGSIPARFMYKVLSKDSLSENLFVKLTSIVNPGNTPMVTYIKGKSYSYKPDAKFSTVIDFLKVSFFNKTKFPQDDPDAEIEYIWDFGDGSDLVIYNSKTNPINENINPVHYYNEFVCDTVKLTAKYNGCKTTYVKNIIVGLEDVKHNNISLSVYPNPATNFANVRIEGVEGNAEIIIYNEIGKQVQSIEVSSNLGRIEKQIDTKKFEKGVYLVKIISEGIEASQKLIIQ